MIDPRRCSTMTRNAHARSVDDRVQVDADDLVEALVGDVAGVIGPPVSRVVVHDVEAAERVDRRGNE